MFSPNTFKKVIFVAGYPKSGNTWLTRLLGDALDCPTGGSMPQQDAVEIACEGNDRPGHYVIRKGHFVLLNDDGPGQIVPRPHRLAWKRLNDNKTKRGLRGHPYTLFLII